MTKYPTIHGYPILINENCDKRTSLILVDKGNEYVVATLYNKEDGSFPEEWSNGSYFNYSRNPKMGKREALGEALELFRRKAG